MRGAIIPCLLLIATSNALAENAIVRSPAPLSAVELRKFEDLVKASGKMDGTDFQGGAEAKGSKKLFQVCCVQSPAVSCDNC